MYQSAFGRHLVQKRRLWCTKMDSDGIWYGEGSTGVPKHHRVAFGTPDRAFRYGSADVTREPHNCEAHTSQQRFSVQNQRILYEMRFAVISYSIVEVCKSDFEGYPELRNFAVSGISGG